MLSAPLRISASDRCCWAFRSARSSGWRSAIVAGGIVTGILAGLFGIGGGAIIVPVLYEVFRLLDVPEEVRMQLCVGTSLAIIMPTTIRSYLAHRAKGDVIPDVLRRLDAAGGHRRRHRLGRRRLSRRRRCSRSPSVVFALSSASSCCSAARAGSSATICPAAPLMSLYGFIIGLWSSLIGRERRLDLQPDPDALRQVDPPRGRDLGRPRRADHHRGHHRLHDRGLAAAGAAAAVVDRLRLADRVGGAWRRFRAWPRPMARGSRTGCRSGSWKSCSACS